ncbi:hypothetical protein [Streptomyces formicae]|uniref:Secreted protein n=1 Tax=Streptomyces formicae TaxID=1616117 RepID=A0ABY3WW83_9ACTN|nr:hypothetical protein [Streptomyces formicae]UNM15547.1 hypothetical protein J4032_32445 [Streptomyces formicae]
MREYLPLLMLAGALAAVLGCFAWLATRVRRRGTGGAAVRAAMASYDEAFRVTAHESYYEIQAQQERKAPLLSPDVHRHPSGPPTGRPPTAHPRPRRGRRGLRRLLRRLR